MSDYLGNLITRTLSPDALVRPRLPSRFESASSNHSQSLELAQEATVDPTPSLIVAPITHSTPTVTHLGLSKPLAPTNLASAEPPSSQPLRAPIFPHLESSESDIKITPATSVTQDAPRSVVDFMQADISNPANSPAVNDPTVGQGSEPSRNPAKIERMSILPGEDGAKSTNGLLQPASIPVRLETRIEAISKGTHESHPEGKIESNAAGLPTNEDRASISSHSIGSSQQDLSNSPKPVVRIEKARAIEAIVPATRDMSHIPSSPARAEAHAINVTIGRIEIRATTAPPTAQKAQSRSAKVLSLESYLRQRAKGGNR